MLESVETDYNLPKILQLNESGTPIRWIEWERVAFFKAKNLIVWEMGDFDWTKFGGVNRMSGLKTSVHFSSIVAVRGKYVPKRTVPALTNENLFGRDLHICAYCGNEFSKKNLTRDHIVPKFFGGPNTWMNCVTACKRCNNKKDHVLLEHTDMKLLYVPYVPNREEALVLGNRRILADQMDFLRSSLPAHSRVHKILN